MASSRAYILLAIAALLGAMAVTMGALGAHGLESRLTPEQLVTFNTGSRYLMYHSIVLLVISGLLWIQPQLTGLVHAAGLILIGALFFSGSLYLMCVEGFIAAAPWIVWVTPIGGLLLILGWLQLAATAIVCAWRRSKTEDKLLKH